MLEVKDVSVSFGTKKILDSVSFSIDEGQWLMIVGPNGAGKTTVINSISGDCHYSGKIALDGNDVRTIKPKLYAREVGVLMQNNRVSYAFSAEEIIRMGRYSYSDSILERKNDEDEAMFRHAVELTGLEKILKQSVLTLSGGELQRVFLAQLICQDPRLIILDEPTNHLDMVYQKQVFEMLTDWLKQPGKAVMSVVHDLSLAKAYGTDALLLYDGHTVGLGSIDTVLTPENLNKVYDMDVSRWMRSMLSQW